MGKSFERADLTANDDGTYTISITPVRKKEKGGSGEVVSYPESKTYTAANLAEAVGKIESFVGGDTKEPGNGEDVDDMDGFMEPREGESTEEEETNE
jgi:hypothetical protein